MGVQASLSIDLHCGAWRSTNGKGQGRAGYGRSRSLPSVVARIA